MPYAQVIGSGGGDFNICSAANPCGLGEGDCDDDSQCKGKLRCFQRNIRRSIPGLYVEHLDAKHDDLDFCYDPDYTNFNQMYAVSRGANGCTAANPCHIGEADCDADTHCAPGLKCFQRQQAESVPGVGGIHMLVDNADVCYDPAGW